MKKLLSFVIFAALLIWTWKVVHQDSNLGFETHAGIQSQLEQLISAAVTAKKPTATEFKMQKLWTEPMAANKVKAHFAYSFKETETLNQPIEQIIEGEAVLYREAPQAANDVEDTGPLDRWVLQSIKTTTDSVIFSEGADLDTSGTPVSTPGDTDPASTPAPTEADAPKITK